MNAWNMNADQMSAENKDVSYFVSPYIGGIYLAIKVHKI